MILPEGSGMVDQILDGMFSHLAQPISQFDVHVVTRQGTYKVDRFFPTVCTFQTKNCLMIIVCRKISGHTEFQFKN